MPTANVIAKDRERFMRARARGQAGTQDASAVIDATRDAIDLRFRSGGSIDDPRRMIPGLEEVPASAVGSISVSPAGDSIPWPSLDLDVYVPGLVSGAFGSRLLARRATGQRGGRRRSKAKGAAARANSAKGGRPRKRLSE